MKVAKASKEDIDTTRSFLRACESFWDSRTRYCLRSSEEDWNTWDDDDPDKILLLKIRKSVASETGCDEDDVDNRIMIYEFLKAKYQVCDCDWARVVMAADVLIDNVCDPMESHLAFYPGFDLKHVENEQ